MKAVVDMNLSPLWVEALLEGGIEAVHWSDVGDPTATDKVILAWAAANERIALTSGRYTLRVSRRLPDDFDNGEPYSPLESQQIALPPYELARPDPEALEWHGDVLFRG